MNRLLFLVSALFCGPGTALAPASVLAQDRAPSNCLALASGDGAEMPVPARFGDTVTAGAVLIRYLEHASFAIVTQDGTIAVTDYTGYIGNPDVVPDVVTMNNAHATHFTGFPDPRIAHVLQGWGPPGRPPQISLDLGGLAVRNVTSDLRGPFGEGARRDGNSIFLFEAAGLCIAHLGHLQQILTPEQIWAIGRVDVVMVPVDGAYTMDTRTMAEVARGLHPRVVVPMHWFSEAGLSEFVAELAGDFRIEAVGGADMMLSLGTLPQEPVVRILTPALIP